MFRTGWWLFVGLTMTAEANLDFGFPPPQLLTDDQMQHLYARDIEAQPEPLAFGHKFMTGGGGEGFQYLGAEGGGPWAQREEVKTDAVLPAYCEPPNPCPVGFSSRDGCMEEFENTAQFSRDYQARQECTCDEEHMFNCPGKSNDAEDFEESLAELLGQQGMMPHKGLIAKKFHEKRSEAPRRKKRSVYNMKRNPYLEGEPLRTVSKKDGRNV